MTKPVKLRATSPLALKHKRYAGKLGAALHAMNVANASRKGVLDGFLFHARKIAGRVSVDVVEVPGRFEGSNQYRGVLDPLVGESTIDGVVVSTSPPLAAMDPRSGAVTEVPQQERKHTPRVVHAFGEPMPAQPFLLYNSFPTEFDGGVIFVHVYTDVEPPSDGGTGYVITDQPVWLAVLVRWAGAGPARSVTFSEEYVQSLTGMGFYPRYVMYEGAPAATQRYGARLPVAHYSGGKLSVAMELQQPAGVLSTTGGLGLLCVAYVQGEAVLDWWHKVGPNDLGPDLSPDTFTDTVVGAYQVSGFDLPAVFSWGDDEHSVVASFRVRSRKAVGSSYRLVTGQAKLLVVDGFASLSVDYLDSVAGADAGLPQVDAERVFIQKYRDDFFLDADGELVRHRRMRVAVRPPEDAGISPAAPTTLTVHAEMARLVTQSASGTIAQSQSALGYGPEEVAPGQAASNGTNGVENVGFSTPVGVGEVWSWGFMNGSGAQTIGIARVTPEGVAAPLAAGIPRSLRLSTYQQEVLGEIGIDVPMGQVATILDEGEPKIAIKKGRFGAMDFVPAASYSRFGTFYLASPATTPKYGRLYD